MLCCLVDLALRERWHAVNTVPDSRRGPTGWSETLHVFSLAQGGLPFTHRAHELKGLDLAGLDRVVARDQLRMVFKCEITSDILDWKP